MGNRGERKQGVVIPRGQKAEGEEEEEAAWC